MPTFFIKHFTKKILISTVTFVILSVTVLLKIRQDNNSPVSLQRTARSALSDDEFDLTQFYNINIPFRLPELTGPKKDWHDGNAFKKEQERSGLGEQGVAAFITNETLKELEDKMFKENGFNALLSDMISGNRSVPDVRTEGCKKKLYSTILPTVSVIIPFHNEYFSIFVRALHSIKNRTPPELLREIIIIDDNSDYEFLKQQLDDYVSKYFKDLVKIIRLKERIGLIRARLVGIREALGDVLVFLDAHIECNYNWLPPLLEPITINKRIVTCPVIDVISYTTLAYEGGNQLGSRGMFKWDFTYGQLKKLEADARNHDVPFRSPVMMGGLFAISKEFFWELGGYDEGLDIWGGEQYELSFKIWMCGGLMCDVPCSRVAHFEPHPTRRLNPRKCNYWRKNHKRVAEVWMDEYAKYAYDFIPGTFEGVETGDLTKQIALREKLQCKSFKWFMEVIAPDILEHVPPVILGFGSGVIQSVAFPQYCIDSMGGGTDAAVGLYPCANNKTNPYLTQSWYLTFKNELRKTHANICLDVYESPENATIWMWSCHHKGGNQFWSYDKNEQMIVHGIQKENCLEAFVENDEKRFVYANPCNKTNKRMKWTFGQVNATAFS